MNKKKIILPVLIIALLLLTVSPHGVKYNNHLWAQKKAKEKEKETNFSLNFNDVEISEFLSVMSQILGKNIILSDKVKGKITINSAQKVPIAEAYDLMKSILEIKGFAVIESDNLIKIVPVKEAVQKNVEVILDGDKVKLNREDAVTFLMELSYADANDVANVLRTLKSPETDIVVYKTLNTIIFSGNSIDIRGLVKIAQSLDKNSAAVSEGDTGIKDDAYIHVVNLENADAVGLSEVLSRIPFSQYALINTQPVNSQGTEKGKTAVSGQGGQSQNPPPKLSIIANKETNSLIINASGAEFKEILRIIKQLDVVRPQILIEAMIVEVNVESNWGFGIDWALGGQSGTHIVGGSSIMGGVPSYSLPNGIVNKTVAVPLKAQTMSLGYLSDTSILGFVLLNATGQDKNVNILSTPHILTIDNHEAEFNVGEEIAVPTNSRIDSSSNIYYTFEYKPVGLKLKITPHITTGEKITLDLFVEVNSVLGSTKTTSTSTIIPPDLAKRDIKTKISIRDGSTIVVGGLMRNTVSEIETKVPLLGDIPLLGWFFKNKTKENSKSNLLVFITPRVVTDPEKIKKITEEKQQEMKKIQEETKK
jgi:general secretion pathway protein D